MNFWEAIVAMKDISDAQLEDALSTRTAGSSTDEKHSKAYSGKKRSRYDRVSVWSMNEKKKISKQTSDSSGAGGSGGGGGAGGGGYRKHTQALAVPPQAYHNKQRLRCISMNESNFTLETTQAPTTAYTERSSTENLFIGQPSANIETIAISKRFEIPGSQGLSSKSKSETLYSNVCQPESTSPEPTSRTRSDGVPGPALTIVSKRIVCSIEALTSANRLTHLSAKETGDLLVVDDEGLLIRRVRECSNVLRKVSRHSSAAEKNGVGGWMKNLVRTNATQTGKVTRLGHLEIEVMYAHQHAHPPPAKKSCRIGAVTWLNHRKPGSHDEFAFTQGYGFVKVIGALDHRVIQQFALKRKQKTKSTEAEIFHSNLYERPDGHLLVGFTESYDIYEYKPDSHGMYQRFQTITLPSRLLCFSYNPVLNMTSIVFNHPTACPLILDGEFKDVARLRIHRNLANEKARNLSQIVILDNGLVLLHDWSPPCSIEVYNLEGFLLGRILRHQLMFSTLSVRRPAYDTKSADESNQSKLQDKTGQKPRIIRVSRVTPNDESQPITSSRPTHQSTIFLFDLTLCCLIEFVLDSRSD